MPILIPTAAEIDAMPPRLRERARRAVARVVAEHMHALDGIAAPDAARALAVEEWARDVRAQSRLMLAGMEPDPDAAAHRAALVDVFHVKRKPAVDEVPPAVDGASASVGTG